VILALRRRRFGFVFPADNMDQHRESYLTALGYVSHSGNC
jgi:hypothetical protein